MKIQRTFEIFIFNSNALIIFFSMILKCSSDVINLKDSGCSSIELGRVKCANVNLTTAAEVIIETTEVKWNTQIFAYSNYVNQPNVVIIENSSIPFMPKFSKLKTPTEISLINCNVETINDYTFEQVTSLESLDLHDNKIEKLQYNGFQFLSDLVTLNLAKNRIKIIEVDAFLPLVKLKMLNISQNFIAKLEFDMFKGPANLESIDLSNNQINHLYSEAFVLHEGLKTLNLSSNFFVELSSNIFESNDEIVNLQLSNNEIRTFEFLKNLCTIQHLNLRNCSLTANMVENLLEILENRHECRANSTSFQESCLETIDLSFNKINPVNLSALGKMHNLKSINIESNNITDIPYNEIMKNNLNFSEVVLNDNAWNCTYLASMLLKLTVKNIKIVRISPILSGTHRSHISCIDCSNSSSTTNSLSCPQNNSDSVNIEEASFSVSYLSSTPKREQYSVTPQNFDKSEEGHRFEIKKQSADKKNIVGGIQKSDQQSSENNIENSHTFNYILLSLLIVVLIFNVAIGTFFIRSYCSKRKKISSEENVVCVYKKSFM